jgi:hypothetical protein
VQLTQTSVLVLYVSLLNTVPFCFFKKRCKLQNCNAVHCVIHILLLSSRCYTNKIIFRVVHTNYNKQDMHASKRTCLRCKHFSTYLRYDLFSNCSYAVGLIVSALHRSQRNSIPRELFTRETVYLMLCYSFQ